MKVCAIIMRKVFPLTSGFENGFCLIMAKIKLTTIPMPAKQSGGKSRNSKPQMTYLINAGKNVSMACPALYGISPMF